MDLGPKVGKKKFIGLGLGLSKQMYMYKTLS